MQNKMWKRYTRKNLRVEVEVAAHGSRARGPEFGIEGKGLGVPGLKIRV